MNVMKYKEWSGWLFPAMGSFYTIFALLDYYYSSFSWHMFLLWLVSVGIFGWYFFITRQYRRGSLNLGWPDVAILFGLLVLFAPLYLWKLQQIPVQVNTDELVLMGYFKSFSNSYWADPFGLMADYFGLPSGVFILFGKIIGLLGEVTLYHTRLVHAFSGLAIILAGFGLFRQILSRRWAVVATIVMGVNHSLIMISRMAMRDNTGLLIELVALNFLVFGLKRRSLFWTFVGGAFAGLSMYTYYPARIVLPLWLLVLSAHWLTGKPRRQAREVLSMGGVTILAWFLVAAPGLVSNISSGSIAMPFQREQFLISHEGRQLQMQWVGARSETDAVYKNIIQGLGMFNARTVDQGWIYPNPGHGFVDPITGCLVWLGLALAVVSMVRRRGSPGDILAVVGLLLLWLSFTFIITKAPNYTRLLIILPFVAYLVAKSMEGIHGVVSKHRAGLGTAIVTLLVGGVVVANLVIIRDFVVAGQRRGNNVGSTLRYVEKLPRKPDYTILLAADQFHPYYSWGGDDKWIDWLSHGNQEAKTKVVSPLQFVNTLPSSQFSVFMNQKVWLRNRTALQSRYPEGTFTQLTTNPQRYVFEVK